MFYFLVFHEINDSPRKMVANSWSSSRNHVQKGAEAMDVYVQDPPKSYGDLEGA